MIPKISFALLSKNKKDKFPIYLRYYDGKSQNKYISTGKVVASKPLFNAKNGRVRGNNDLARNINKDLDLIYKKATDIVSDLYNKNTIDFQIFKQKMKQKEGESFYTIAKRMVDESLSYKKITKSTYYKYNSILSHFNRFDPTIGSQSINKHTIIRFSKFLGTTMKKDEPSNHENTVFQYVSNLKFLYDRVIDENGLVDNQPFKGILKKLPKLPPKKAKPYTLDELMKIKDHALSLPEGNEKITCKVVVFCVGSGLRISDALKVRYSDIKITRKGSFYIFKKNQKTQRTGKVVPTPIFDFAADFLGLNNMALDSEELIFGISATTVQKHLNNICKKLGIEKKTTHSARRSTATIGRSIGIDLDDLSEFLGHSTKEMTKQYADLDTEAFIDKMNSQFSISKTKKSNKGKNVVYSQDAQRFMYDLGKKIDELREQKNMTKVEIAERLGMKMMNYSYITGGSSSMSVEFLFDVCRVLGCEIGDVLGEVNKEDFLNG